MLLSFFKKVLSDQFFFSALDSKWFDNYDKIDIEFIWIRKLRPAMNRSMCKPTTIWMW